MSTPFHPTQHPHRAMLHNEIHARPPEAMNAPLAIAHVVMLADAAGREASRAHVAALLRDHHMALPDAQTTHLRMDLGTFRMRWELHTEFVTWTFMVPAPVEAFGEREPVSAVDSVPRDWLAALPGQCLCSLNLWVLPTHTFGSGSLVKHVLHEDTLVASTVADGHGEVYTDFAIHADGFSRMVLLAGGMTPRRLGRLVQRLLEIETYRMAALLGLPAAREAASVLAFAERELAALADLRSANRARQAEWDQDNQITLSYRGNELAGEVGEACNVIKKLERERMGIRGSRATKEQLAEELADVVICADLIAMDAGSLGRPTTMGSPMSPPSRSAMLSGTDASRGTSRSATSESRIATSAPPPEPKRSSTVPSGWGRPAMFSMTPKTFCPVCLATMPLRTATSAAAGCGVVTTSTSAPGSS